MRLEVVKKEAYNCFQNQVAAVAKHYQTDYRMMMLELWGFIYNQDKCTLGESMGLVWTGELEYRKNLLLDFHGIKFEIYKSILDVKKYVRERPVACYIDSFDCEWLPVYQKQHRQHICNIVEMDQCYCYCQDDSMDKSTYKKFEVNSIDLIIKNILVFFFEPKIKQSKEVVNQTINEAVRRYDEGNCLEKMGMFVEDFPKKFKIAEEDPMCSRVIMFLKGLGDDKKNLTEFFDYLNQNYGTDVEEAIQILDSQAKKFWLIRNYLIKTYFCKKSLNLDILSKELNEILENELALYNFMKALQA